MNDWFNFRNAAQTLILFIVWDTGDSFITYDKYKCNVEKSLCNYIYSTICLPTPYDLHWIYDLYGQYDLYWFSSFGSSHHLNWCLAFAPVILCFVYQSLLSIHELYILYMTSTDYTWPLLIIDDLYWLYMTYTNYTWPLLIIHDLYWL